MLTYRTINAGMPSDAAGLTSYYLDQSVPREVADIARYYTGVDAAGAEIRRDIHPLVAQGLGIDPTRELSRKEISALLAGRRADGEKIEGRRYSEARTYTEAGTG